MTQIDDTRLDEASTDLSRNESTGPAATDGAAMKIRFGDRIRWWRTAQNIQAQHDDETVLQLRRLERLPVSRLAATPNGAIRISVPGWHVDLAEVSAVAMANMLVLSERACRIEAAGRYGRFWWVTILGTSPDGARRATALASRIRLTENDEGGRQLPDTSPGPEYVAFARNPRQTHARTPQLDAWARWPEHRLACWWR